jgi:hypothetical protein
MSDEPKKRSRGLWIWWAIIVLLLAYPLSYGPAFRLALDSRDSGTKVLTLSTVYAPIGWVCTRSKPARAATLWYLGLWIRRH